MRYDDWDVLLFPSGEGGAHVPVKEFRTACYTENRDYKVTPLLTTFIPTLEKDHPFQISIHSWTKTGPLLQLTGAGARELWQVKVVIDRVCVCTETFAADTNWPQIISSTTPTQAEHEIHPLCFPPFHREIVRQSHWDAADPHGRIRVELSIGYSDEKYSRFVKCANVVTFAFQPAPASVLQYNGISWPNPHMYADPAPLNPNQGMPGGVAQAPNIFKHKRAASISNVTMPAGLSGLPVQPPTTALFPSKYEANGNQGGSSRSTSTYSAFSESAAPFFNPALFVPAYPGSHAEAARKTEGDRVRLQSDQFNQIMNAVRQNPQQQAGNQATTMPPPPLPLHTLGPKDNAFLDQRTLQPGSLMHAPPASDVFNFNGRRAESRYSDISMHAGCNSWPTCTTEDAEGCIVHDSSSSTTNTPVVPATMVRGRKEGSSPTKPRDFFSTILETTTTSPTTATAPQTTAMATPMSMSKEMRARTIPLSSSPADQQGRKRTRSALKSLNINDGSPEKKDVSAKPPRKASKASMSSKKSDKENENVLDGQDMLDV